MDKRRDREVSFRALDDILNMWPCPYFRLADTTQKNLAGLNCVGVCTSPHAEAGVDENGEAVLGVTMDSMCWKYNSRKAKVSPPCGCGEY